VRKEQQGCDTEDTDHFATWEEKNCLKNGSLCVCILYAGGSASFNSSFLGSRSFYSACIFSPPKCFCLKFCWRSSDDRGMGPSHVGSRIRSTELGHFTLHIYFPRSCVFTPSSSGSDNLVEWVISHVGSRVRGGTCRYTVLVSRLAIIPLLSNDAGAYPKDICSCF